jgi:hypothetical protein
MMRGRVTTFRPLREGRRHPQTMGLRDGTSRCVVAAVRANLVGTTPDEGTKPSGRRESNARSQLGKVPELNFGELQRCFTAGQRLSHEPRLVYIHAAIDRGCISDEGFRHWNA